MTQIDLLKDLVAKSTGEDRAKYEGQLLVAIQEDAEAKANAKMDAKIGELELKIAKGKTEVRPVIEVGTPGEYKGLRMKAVMDTMIHKAPRNIAAAWKSEPKRVENVAKFWIDMVDKSMTNPMSVTKAATEGTTTAGGYLTPDELSDELFAYARESSLALQHCTIVPMKSDVLNLNGENAKVSVAYTAENVAATETTPSFRQVTMTAKRMDAYTEVTNELIQDANVRGGIVAALLDQFMEAVGLKVDSTVFACGGDPMSSVFTAKAGYSEVFASTSTNFSAVTFTNLTNIISKIPKHYLRRGAKWWTHNEILWKYLYNLKDSQNRPLFVPQLTEEAPARILGYPVLTSTQMPSTTAVSTGYIGFGDLGGVAIGDRMTDISLFYDPYSKSKQNVSTFLLFTRWGYGNDLLGPSMIGRIVTAGS